MSAIIFKSPVKDNNILNPSKYRKKISDKKKYHVVLIDYQGYLDHDRDMEKEVMKNIFKECAWVDSIYDHYDDFK
ncbi:MAG: hypothetical protein ABIQ74_13510 [Chitinophagales bacterium]